MNYSFILMHYIDDELLINVVTCSHYEKFMITI